MRRKRALEDNTQPPRKVRKSSTPKETHDNLFSKQPEFCHDLTHSLLSLAELIETSERDPIDAIDLLHYSKQVLKKVGLLKCELLSHLPRDHPERAFDKTNLILVLQEILSQAQSWQEKICLLGQDLYKDGSSLPESSLHCLLTWQQVFNQLVGDTLKAHNMSATGFESGLQHFAKDDEIEELLSRLKVATSGNPLIVSWKQHLPTYPVEFTESAAIHFAEKLHFLCKFAYEKAHREAKELVRNEVAFKKHLEQLYSKYEKLTYRTCHEYAKRKFSWWCEKEDEGLIWIKMAPLRYSGNHFYVRRLGQLKREFLDHIKKLTWTSEVKTDDGKKGEEKSSHQATFVPIMHGGKAFYIPVVQPLQPVANGKLGNNGTIPFVLPQKRTNGS